MEKNVIVQTNKQKQGKDIIDLLWIGEMNLLAEMLSSGGKKVSPNAARARLLRDSPEAIKAAEQIIKYRNRLITNFPLND